MNHRIIAWKSRVAAVAAALLVALAPALSQPTQQAYVKPSNTGSLFSFGGAIAISGETMVVGAPGDNSNATGVNGSQLPAPGGITSGAAYVFTRNGTTWTQQAYLKASNTGESDQFGFWVAISGNTIVVGSLGEDSAATGVNGNSADESGANSGAAYVFVRDGTNWTQQAYLKASNTGANDRFGASVAISGDIIVVGSRYEDSNATGINGNQTNNSASDAGAAYVFAREGTNWAQQAYLKASNAGAGDNFGSALAVSGETLVAGASNEDSDATGVNGTGTDGNPFMMSSGAAYVFVRTGTNWSQQAYLKASNTGGDDLFGGSVAISGDTVVVGAIHEDSNAIGVNGNQSDDSSYWSGAAYVFSRQGTNWSQQAYLKASNTETNDEFGSMVSIAGHTIVVGASQEDSGATGVNGLENDNSRPNSGAAYVFVRQGRNWTQQAYLKASNTGSNDQFGWAAISGNTVVVGANHEGSNAVGINGDQTNNSLSWAGAAYVFSGVGLNLQVVAAQDVTAGYVLATNTAPGLSYTLERASNINGPWQSVETLKATLPDSLLFHDTNAPTGQAFYRVAQQ